MSSSTSTTPLAPRLWLHRFGSLSVPGSVGQGYDVFSSAAALAAADGLTWRHVWVDSAWDSPSSSSSHSPSSSLSGSARAGRWGLTALHPEGPLGSVQGVGPACGSGFDRFMSAAINQLRASLEKAGRTLEVVRASSSSSSSSSSFSSSTTEALLAYAKKCGATEIHSVMCRDPWSAEADAALRSAAAQVGVSSRV